MTFQSLPASNLLSHISVLRIEPTNRVCSRQSEYPGHFRTWKVTKRVVNEDKGKIVSVLGRRKRTGASSSRVILMEGGREKPVDSKKIRIFLKNDKITAATMVLPPGL